MAIVIHSIVLLIYAYKIGHRDSPLPSEIIQTSIDVWTRVDNFIRV